VQVFKKHIIRFVTLVVALQLLNLSIYAQDFKPIYNEAGSDETNITETVVEYVVEIVLGHTNAIPEQSQHHKDLHFHKHMSFKAISFNRDMFLSASQLYVAKMPIPLHETFDDLYMQEINPQPPKA
jgi:hypothetical protein